MEGWWQGHLLHCKGEPVAFLVGCQIDNTYFGLDMGYNPAWSQLSVGTVALSQLIGSLIAQSSPPTRFDFGRSDHEYKRRLCNRSWGEKSFALVPRNSRYLWAFRVVEMGPPRTKPVSKFLKKLGFSSRKEDFLREPRKLR